MSVHQLNCKARRSATRVAFYVCLLFTFPFTASAEYIHSITIDGNFSDWAAIKSYSDPTGGVGVLHAGIPDTHDTDHGNSNDVPAYVNHPDIDLVEFKFTHDHDNLYAYFRATGQIGRTANTVSQKGRYYVIITMDVDSNTATGYGLHEGGYFPTSYGYDMNMEVEYYSGAFNTGHYLNHGATNDAQEAAAMQDQTNGIVKILPGTYSYYTQWVWFDNPIEGTNRLPVPDDYASITFVSDRGPVYQGIIRIARSADGHQAEMVAPFRGFMRAPGGSPIMALGKTLKLSFSLEASGELAPGLQWASDTGDPIVNYYLSPFTAPNLTIARSGPGSVVLSWAAGATGMKLQRRADLVAGNWQDVLGSTITNQMTLPTTNSAAYFRLIE